MKNFIIRTLIIGCVLGSIFLSAWVIGLEILRSIGSSSIEVVSILGTWIVAILTLCILFYTARAANAARESTLQWRYIKAFDIAKELYVRSIPFDRILFNLLGQVRLNENISIQFIRESCDRDHSGFFESDAKKAVEILTEGCERLESDFVEVGRNFLYFHSALDASNQFTISEIGTVTDALSKYRKLIDELFLSVEKLKAFSQRDQESRCDKPSDKSIDKIVSRFLSTNLNDLNAVMELLKNAIIIRCAIEFIINPRNKKTFSSYLSVYKTPIGNIYTDYLRTGLMEQSTLLRDN